MWYNNGKYFSVICIVERKLVNILKNYYSEMDGIICTFSDIEEKNGFDEISVHFERPNDTGFDFSEWKLPNNMCYKSYGFSEDELLEIEQYLRNNSFLIWEIAREKAGDRSA